MHFNRLIKTLLLVIIISFSGFSHAVPIKWEIRNVEFTDGGLLFGSFKFDMNTGHIYEVMMTTTADSNPSFTGHTYIDMVFRVFKEPNGALGAFHTASSPGDLTGKAVCHLTRYSRSRLTSFIHDRFRPFNSNR